MLETASFDPAGMTGALKPMAYLGFAISAIMLIALMIVSAIKSEKEIKEEVKEEK